MADQRGEAAEHRRVLPPNLILFGPPGVGKSRVGEALARELGRPFVDTDERVVELAGKPIPEIFAEEGEAAFRDYERQVCTALAGRAGLVVACGGGTLLAGDVRDTMENSGTVICLRAGEQVLAERLATGEGRPLLAGQGHSGLRQLVAARKPTYDSFALQAETEGVEVAEIARRVARLARAEEEWTRRVDQGAGYRIHAGWGLSSRLDSILPVDVRAAPLAVVSDEIVAPLHGRRLAEGLGGTVIEVPAGEGAKSMSRLERLHSELLRSGLDRGGVVVAVGGGVVTDLAGFAAATFMRGIRWVAVPTTLLGVVDAAIGGKVGVDLPEGKNLVGAFHPPREVIVDFDVLDTLPAQEWENGLAELIKAAIIGDAELFAHLEAGAVGPTSRWIRRAQAVKIELVEADPKEAGPRAKLNAGHTVAHALETATGYGLPHGHAVALGLVAEADMAEGLELAEEGWRRRLAEVLGRFGLPVAGGGWHVEEAVASMQVDKKARGGTPRFALPVGPGRVQVGVEVPPVLIRDALDGLKDRA